MKQVVDCPLCNGGKLNIDVPKGYKIITSGRLKDLLCVVNCKNCNRKVKYNIIKENK
jgi:hypothetical protein